METYPELIKRLDGRRHLLLGNGFSISLFRDIFSYQSLYDALQEVELHCSADRLYQVLHTHDFEFIIRSLNAASDLSRVYCPTPDAADQMRADADAVRNGLIEAIAQYHPATPGEIRQDQFEDCTRFLAGYENIFTLNYDLLLYWTLMWALEHQANAAGQFQSDDGFGWEDAQDGRELIWSADRERREQTVFYLHGALHLFQSPLTGKIRKQEWVPGSPLVDQVQTEINNEHYPLFVAEGTSEEKVQKISSSAYLMYCHDYLKKLKGTLVIFGWKIGSPDQHVIRELQRSGLEEVCVGVYGNPESTSNVELREFANALVGGFPFARHPRLSFFEVDGSTVWG